MIEKMMMKILIVFVLGMNYPSCAGFPVYDYDSSSLREALRVSVAKVNSQSLSPYLFRAFRSSVKRVNVLDQDSLNMDLEFGIRETTCRRDSGEDPATCDFQRGYYVMFLGDILGSSKRRNNYLLESLRGIFPPGNRGYPNKWHRLQE
ncbi:secreted phosphoprotein 24 isoform X2 [Callorhinus ursinus]|uniref:secreted phosphoprotein 24 isoform X2 n=1 Tax=Callorhinus ursinus TaxID=34884 RepID=UPI003CD04B1B